MAPALIPPLTYEPAEYKKLVLELDKRGYQIMTHTYRPDSSRLVVDTYEEVEKINGPRDRRLRVEHADFVPAQDIPRLAKHSMIASMQPTFCCDENGANYDPRDRDHNRPMAEYGKKRSHAGLRQRLAVHLAAKPIGGDPGGRHAHDLAAGQGW